MTGGPIEDYLARLRAGLRTAPARTAEIVAEAEDHLRESAAARRAAGLDEAAAQRAAVAAFGPVRQVTRAHRPTLSAYAAAAGVRAWPLFGCYLLLTAVIGAALAVSEMVMAHGDINLVNSSGAFGTVLARPDQGQLAVTLASCALAGLFVLAVFLLVRRRNRQFGAALVPLPRGLFPLVAAAGLLALAMAQLQDRVPQGLAWLPPVAGSVELFDASTDAAALLGIGCVLWALAVLADPGVQARPVPVRLAVSGYAAQASLTIGQLLGSWVLVSALTGGLGFYVAAVEVRGSVPYLAGQAALVGGCALAGALLFAGCRTARRRRDRYRPLPARLGQGPSLLLTVAGLAVLAVAEYLFFVGDVAGQLRVPLGVAYLILGSQWAVVLMGSVRALRTVAALARWLAAARGGEHPPPEGADPVPV